MFCLIFFSTPIFPNLNLKKFTEINFLLNEKNTDYKEPQEIFLQCIVLILTMFILYSLSK